MVGEKVSGAKYGLVRSGKRMLAALFSAVMLAGTVSGCGGASDGTTADGMPGDSDDGAQGNGSQTMEEIGQSWPADTPLGRYVEETPNLPDGFVVSGVYDRIHKLEDGSLIITEGDGFMLVSKDNGKNWKEDKRSWRTRLKEEGKYIMSTAIGSDNTVAVVWTELLEDDVQDEAADSGKNDRDGEVDGTGGEDGSESEAAEGGEDGESGKGEAGDDSEPEETETGDSSEPKEAGGRDSGESEEINGDKDSSEDKTVGAGTAPATLDTKLLVVKPDGTEIAVEVAVEEDDRWINSVYISETGKIIVGTLGSNLYEVTEDYSLKKYLAVAEGRPELIRFHQNLMFMDGWGYKTPLIYDMEAGEYLEDPVLEDFVEENYSDSSSEGFYDMFLFSGGDDILYIAGDKGLYRHVLGGGAVEQVIDGSLSSFSNPAADIADMAVLEDNEFLAVFTNGKLVRYVYDPDIPTVPVGQLRVYSLEERPTARQIINLYQMAHPAVYVEYEVGMGERNSVTREDALKRLNTQILAGEGPDVLILDNMPIDSYIEKGLLADLSPLLNEMSGENGIFENVKNAFMTDGHIYTVPCELQLPFILGRGKDTAQMKDLEGIADTVENMRRSNPGKNLLEIASAKGIMRMFSLISAPAWRTESGEIDSEAISDYLIQTKRIYDAQMDGLPERAIEDWQELSDYYVEDFGKPIEDTVYIRTYAGELQFMGDVRKCAMGSLSSWYGYSRAISAWTTDGFEDCEIIPMNGQCENVFWARTMLGINAVSENAGMAEDFLRTALDKENQMGLPGGMPVTREGLLADLEGSKSRSQSGIFGSVAASNAEGTCVSLTIRFPEDDEVEFLVNWIESADTVYIEDAAFEEAVYEEGVAYINEEKSLESAVDGIEKKLAIYLAE